MYDEQGRLVYSSDPDADDLVGELSGRSRTSVVEEPERMVLATVPVLATRSDGTEVELVGYVQVGRDYPRPWA